MAGWRTAAEENAIRMLEHGALEQVAIADETRLEIALVVLIEEVDHFVHQFAVEWVATELGDDDGKVVTEESLREFCRWCINTGTDEQREPNVLENREDVLVGVVIDGRVEDKAVKAVVVSVFLDVFGRCMVRFRATDSIS